MPLIECVQLSVSNCFFVFPKVIFSIIYFVPVLSVKNLTKNDFIDIFPNPNSGQFTVILNKEIQGNMFWEIKDIAGRKIINGDAELTSNQISIDTLNNLLSGTYFFTLTTQDGMLVKKLIIYE